MDVVSNTTRTVIADIPKEIQQMLGDDECVYYKGQSKRCTPGGELVNPTEIFVTSQRIILYNHKFFGRGVIEDLHYANISNTQLKKGMLSCDIVLKPRFPGNDTIVIHAVNKQKVYDINALITTGIRDAAYVQGGRFPQ
jgi:Bacterial PH domain